MLCYQFRLIQMYMMIPFNMLNGYLREERCVKGCTAHAVYGLIIIGQYHWIGVRGQHFTNMVLPIAVVSSGEIKISTLQDITFIIKLLFISTLYMYSMHNTVRPHLSAPQISHSLTFCSRLFSS